MNLKSVMMTLYEHYQIMHPLPPDASDSSYMSSDFPSSTFEDDDSSWSSEFKLKVKKKQHAVQRNEFERYMEDDVEDDYDGFDILKWWKGKATKYYFLSCITKDILVIPVSTVSSESAFSTGGRVLDPFRSSLQPSTVEALICAQNWLKTPDKQIDLRAQMDEIEKIEAGSALYRIFSICLVNY